MADMDLIARVYPCYDEHGQNALKAINLVDNKPRYVPGSECAESLSDRRSRESTEEPEPSEADDQDDKNTRLELRFSNGPKTSHGFVFGCDKDCDVVLPKYRGVSSYHFALTFDDHNRPIVKDIGSLIGTQVKYGNGGEGSRRNFVWIVGGHDVPQRRTPIVIHVTKHLKFQLVISHHDINSQLYKDNVEYFRQVTADTEDLFGRLKFTADTERATETHTPSRGPIFLKKRLGKGSFGVVTHFWNVSTAEEYALKQPSVEAIEEKRFKLDSWKREAAIMGRINHEHIVRLLWAEEEPWPKLCLEYVPGGSFHKREHISVGESTQVLCQLLSALAYLHRLDPPILHRDIKPENILVQSRYSGYIHVKFGDFGISKERRGNSNWKTICGTWKYAAPEILEMYKNHNPENPVQKLYTTAVDIWSLGVVVFELLCELPPYDEEYALRGTRWGKVILKKLRNDLIESPNEVLQFLSTAMLIMVPEARFGAQECYDEVIHLRSTSEAGLQMLQPMSSIEEQQVTARNDDSQTAILRRTVVPPDPGCAGDASIDTDEIAKYIIDSAEIKRRIRSNNPTLTSQRRRSGGVSKPSPAIHSRRARHDQAAAEPHTLARGDEVNSGIAHCHQDPVSRDPFFSWSLLQSVQGTEPDLVAGGIGYARDEDPINGGRERSWGVEIPPPAEDKLQEDAEPVNHGVYDDEAIAAALLLAIQSDGRG